MISKNICLGGETIPRKASESRLKARKIVEFAKNKQAQRPVILDVRDFPILGNYFIICSGDTPPQIDAICKEIVRNCKENNIAVHHWEKDDSRQWLLIDCFDVIVHIFTEEKRNYYRLEELWKTAKRLR
ncbi:MAG: ribosome silencing factor [Candidatus Omnitrophota bacterium]